jgi:histone acetyltransferase (RNA polymerase elongator complex component)
MISLLEIAHKYVRSGRVNSLRCSTRPDYISDEILAILKKYGMKTIELGLQSCVDSVLDATKRGHNFEAERLACEKIVKSGFDLVGQMMIGLPGSDPEKELMTARFIIDSGAVGARIYPTVVFRDTELCDMTVAGIYEPLTVDEAVERSAAVLEEFIDSSVRVIRIGLQATENLNSDKTYFAGPNHPALGELVENEYYYKKISKILSAVESAEENIEILVSPGSLSKAVGQKKRNRLRLGERYKNLSFGESNEISGYGIMARLKDGEIKCI